MWSKDDDVLVSEAYGVDTETTLIEKGPTTPDLVLMQVFDGVSVDLVWWDNAESYLDRVMEASPSAKFYFLNAAFDLRVLKHTGLYLALEDDRVVDIGLRHALYRTATRGYYEKPLDLANLTRIYLDIELNKDDSVRLGFHRGMELSRADIKYAAMDAVVTLSIADKLPEQPYEGLETRASLALDLVAANGMLVDREAFYALRDELTERLGGLAEQLETHGYRPDPSSYKPAALCAKLAGILGIEAPERTWNHNILRGALFAAFTASAGVSGVHDDMKAALEVGAKLPGDVTEEFDTWLNANGFDPLPESRKSRPWIMTLLKTLELAPLYGGLPALKAAVSEAYNASGGWVDECFLGSGVFLQRRLEALEEQHGVEFDRTDTGKIKTGADELWRLLALGIEDEFLETYYKYKHLEKMVSTYLNGERIDPDGRVRPRFTTLVRTGRTSCSKPNLQNVPKEKGFRECYVAPEGYALLSVDYSQLELCALAQHCWSTYNISRMRDLINADLDLHSWFAAKRLGIITMENDYDGTPESRDRVAAILAKVKSEMPAERQKAKASNFGFPGGRGAGSLLMEVRASGDYDTTKDELEDLRESWFKAFPEMKFHMSPRLCGNDQYEGFNTMGRVRKFCSFNSACNFPFQSLAAMGAKAALWRAVASGYKVVNFIHDELLVEVPIAKLDECARAVRTIMEEEMKRFIPDVAIRTSCEAMSRWSKNAEAVFDADGRLAVWSPAN